MGVTREVAAQNRERILAAAERLFRARGVEGVSLVDLMAAAGLTRGGFYNHFASKDALVAAVVARAMEEGYRQLDASVVSSRDAGRDPVLDQVEWYLSEAHRDAVEDGCPNAGFAAEADRMASEGATQYAAGLARTLERFVDAAGDEPGDRDDAIASFTQMVGALLLSRATRETRPDLSADILRAAAQDLRVRRTG